MIPKPLQKLIDEIESLENEQDFFEFLIELAQELPLISNQKKNAHTKLLGCASNAWIDIEEKEGKIYIVGDAEALISKGMIAFFCLGLSGCTKKEILSIPQDFFFKNRIIQSLSPSRTNGTFSTWKKIQRFCETKI